MEAMSGNFMAGASQCSGVTVRRRVEVPIDVAGVVYTASFLTFNALPDRREHIAIVFGNLAQLPVPMVRVHSECLTGDVFGSFRCDCGHQLADALSLLAAGGGVLLYMRQEGRGIGLYNKLDAYALQDQGHDTFEANSALGFAGDLRDFSVAANMLLALGVERIKLVTNNPDKVAQLEQGGVQIVDVLARPTYQNPHNRAYLEAKRVKAFHRLSLDHGGDTSESWGKRD